MDRRPNLLLLWTDEQRADTLGAYGNEAIETPNLDRLSADSTVFENAYCAQPVCTPARATVLTGLWPHAHGCWPNNRPLDEGIACLPERLPPGRWETGYIGKWHLGDEVFAQHGFDTWVSVEDGYYPYYRPHRDPEARSSYYHFLRDAGYDPGGGRHFGREFTCMIPEVHSKPAFQADAAIRFIDEHRERPWCLSVNTLEPHMPFTSVRNGQYDPDRMPLDPTWGEAPEETCLLRHRLYAERQRLHGHAGVDLGDPDAVRRCLARYWGLCSLVDTHFGRIVDHLQRIGLYDDTLIVFTSDHGDLMGAHAMLAKVVMYEECMRVPWMVKLPGQREQRRFAEPVGHIDLLPTVLDCLGVDGASDLQGESLLPVCRGEAAPAGDVVVEWQGHNGFGNEGLEPEGVPAELRHLHPDQAFLERAWLAPIRSLRAPEGWLYTCSAAGERELYHLVEDPHQRRNLAPHPGSAGRLGELHARLVAWQRRNDDPVELPPP